MTEITGLITIVDDTPANLEVICEALSDAGFEVAIATSGERALQQIELEIPDLILLDIMMPGIDGFETCKHLKANPHTSDVPIIFMTALADTNSKVQALSLGAVDYVTKPFEEAEVLARVKTHLKLRRLTLDLERQVRERTAELEASQLQLIQSEKMSSLGNLVAGVAHEVNNPVAFLRGGLNSAQYYTRDVLNRLELYEQCYPEPLAELEENAEEINLEFLCEDFPKLLTSMGDAIERIIKISDSLRLFARTEGDRAVGTNLHDCLDSTLSILKYRLKANTQRPEITVKRDYGDIPEIHCYPDRLNQVFMNLLANAIDALDEAAQTSPYPVLEDHPHPPEIVIHTQLASTAKAVELWIGDNGPGISPESLEKIFDRHFTTKVAGKGTGLGLAIARQIVEEKHSGKIEARSQLGRGTEFLLRLPLAVRDELP